MLLVDIPLARGRCLDSRELKFKKKEIYRVSYFFFHFRVSAVYPSGISSESAEKDQKSDSRTFKLELAMRALWGPD